MRPTLYTIGHSSRSFESFLALLRAHGITQIVDVRSIPKSKHNPQFARETLARSLRARRINYRWLPALGGLRHARKDSPNTGWRNASFRSFADHMATEEFASGLSTLEKVTATRRSAIMCAEAVPWRCHRSLVADALVLQGWTVRHIVSGITAKPHTLTPFLRRSGGKLVYP
ncbi:MAG TPA: DUF488 domain-containing protein [Rhizomicrobium sp.]|jgi:uncharacterized protein (DUF488 family)